MLDYPESLIVGIDLLKFLVVDNTAVLDVEIESSKQSASSSRIESLCSALEGLSYEVKRCDGESLKDSLDELSSQVVILFGWPGFDLELLPSDVPLVVDLSTRYVGNTEAPGTRSTELVEGKLCLLSRANLFLCATGPDRNYFYGWLVQALSLIHI